MTPMTKSSLQRHNRGNNDLYASLDFEDLEARVMLAGDVTTAFSDGTLTITGDGEANALRIDQAGDTVVVTGLFDAGNVNPAAFTTINGGDQFVGVTDLQIHLNGGDDILLIGQNSSLTLSGDLNIDMSTGDDILVLGTHNEVEEPNGETELVVSLEENGDNGNGLGFVSVAREINIELSSGDDTLFMEDVSVGTEPDRDAMRIYAGTGSDGIDMKNVLLNEDLYMELGAGNDIVNAEGVSIAHDVELFGGDGNDIVVLNSVVVGASDYEFTPDNADIDLGSGDDILWAVGPVGVQDRLRVIGGAGNDIVAGTDFVAVLNGPVEVDAEVVI